MPPAQGGRWPLHGGLADEPATTGVQLWHIGQALGRGRHPAHPEPAKSRGRGPLGVIGGVLGGESAPESVQRVLGCVRGAWHRSGSNPTCLAPPSGGAPVQEP